MANFFRNIPYIGWGSWQEPVPSVAFLPTYGEEVGDVRITTDTQEAYVWNGTSWVLFASPSFAAGIVSLNGLVNNTQFFATGTSGTDFNIVSSIATHTFNIPDASLTNRGVVTNIAQSFGGTKTFNVAPIISPFTSPGIVHNDASGLLSSSLIINADIDIAANINFNRMAALTVNRALQSDGSGIVSVSSVTSTELSYVSGVTSAIQTQLNNKQPLDATLTALAAYNTNGYLVQTAADTFVGRSIAAGTGITVTNGNAVAGNTQIAISDTAVTPGTYGSSTQVGVFTVNQQGQITNAVNTAISLTSANITDFNEAAQDAVGNILTDTSTIDFTYNDAVNTITADIVNGSISNIHISNTAAIAYSKLNLTNSIVNADIATGAAIARTKLASGTPNHVIINDGSGVLSSEAQLAVTRGGTGLGTVTTGDILYASASNVLSRLPIGSNNQILQVIAGLPSWQTITDAGITSLNGLTALSQTFATGTSGTDFNIVSSVSTHTFNIPDASATARGLVTTGAQVIAGTKSFSSAPIITPFSTAGVVHNNASGLLSSSLIVNADVDAAAAIAYSKLNLSNSIVNADINTAAAIAYSKLNLANSIVNADIATGAAIARNKIAAGTPNHVVINDGSGVLSSEAQLALTRGGTNASLTAVNGGVVYSTASALAITSAGTSGQLLQSNGAAAPTFVSTSTITGIVHANLTGLAADDHTQYALLAGRSGGQTLTGGTASGNNLVLRSTTDATKGQVYVDETTASTSTTTGALRVGGGLGVASSIYMGGTFDLRNSSTEFLMEQATVNTTDATVTTLTSVTIPTNSVQLIEARIVAFRTGGSAGAAGDSATYIRTVRAKNVAGTVTANSIQTTFTSEDQAGWNATFDASGTTIRVRINGATNNNVTWQCTLLRSIYN